jgi:hypothetical protein
MKHFILAKFKPEVTDKKALLDPIQSLFSAAGEIPGVHGASVYPCCIARENRYDIMIVLDMDRDALPLYDVSKMHHDWKSRYGDLLEKKAIFDCEM